VPSASKARTADKQAGRHRKITASQSVTPADCNASTPYISRPRLTSFNETRPIKRYEAIK